MKLRKLQEAERRELKKRSALEYEAALKAERDAANEAYLRAQEAAERGACHPPAPEKRIARRPNPQRSCTQVTRRRPRR